MHADGTVEAMPGVQGRSGDRLAQSTAPYYGAAWAALGRLLLTGESLGGCAPVPASS